MTRDTRVYLFLVPLSLCLGGAFTVNGQTRNNYQVVHHKKVSQISQSRSILTNNNNNNNNNNPYYTTTKTSINQSNKQTTMMKLLPTDTQSITNLYYFFAGALLPTIAFKFLLRNPNKKKNKEIIFEIDNENDNDNDDDVSEDDEILFDPIRINGGNHPSEWGIQDCPYKVSSLFVPQCIKNNNIILCTYIIL